MEGVEDVAERDEGDGSARSNLGIEDVKNDLDENFEIGSLEDLFEGEEEEIVDDAKKADLEEMFASADNSIEKADDDSKEDVTNDTATDEPEVGEEAVEDDEPSQGDADAANDVDGANNDVGGTAIFDSIDLVRQAVEFLTVDN